jgi:phosphonate transport system ATP-binding protein
MVASPEDPAKRRAESAGAPDPLVSAADIWFSYDRKAPVLRGVSFAVQPQEMIMVLGRSGSGKTTLLKLLKGLLQPERGTVTSGVVASLGSAGVAYIPQTLGLVRNMTALENALMGALVRTGFARSLVRSFPGDTVEEARAVLSRLGLGAKAGEPVFNMSGGERQRVAIARALMQRPALILADEFVSQLDYHTGEEIMEMMREVADTGVGIVMTTHEVDVALRYADVVAVMKEGQLVHSAERDSMTEERLLELLK